ncbi:MAG: UbiA family prenyltransferase [Polyangiaceae bacterium]|nr:UbiA family prenyltransferase [Polyangiaceae bacterium]
MTPPTIEPLAPFGAVLSFELDTPFESIAEEDLHGWIARYRVVVLRNLRAPERNRLPLMARRLGPLQAWSFGSIHELVVKPSTDNYLYTDRAVPLHWDGAFAGQPPRYLVFHCLEAPEEGEGGETLFVDTAKVWLSLSEPERDRYRALRFRYSTEKRAHYGGSFVSALVVEHETRGDTVLRFAEPVDDLNAVAVEAVGLDPLQSAALIGELRERLTKPEVTLAHAWHAGDVVIADNLGLLHGRRAFPNAKPRVIRRVNVLPSQEHGALEALRASLRIRRPEFMVAEIPIFLIPALLSQRRFDATSWFELAVLFFLLFHVGDMANCLADRELDSVYKTRLSEAVYALGPKNVAFQIAASSVLALGIAAEISLRSGGWEPLALVAAGLALGLQYSFKPLYAKGRGLLQVLTLWTIIFVGPMTLVWVVLGRGLEPLPLALFASYGLMQQGIVLVNTAEDLPDDRAMNIRTSAIALGLETSLSVALGMVIVGGAGVLGLLGHFLADARAPVMVSLLLLIAALAFVSSGIARARAAVGRALAADPDDEERAIKALRPHARRVPIWIAATALATLVAAGVTRC